MATYKMSLLRGVCQTPAYSAHAKGFFEQEGLSVELEIQPTAWMVPAKLGTGESHFAVIPWTRVASSAERDIPLVLLCGSGCEEAAIVVRKGLDISQVKKVAVPLRGGMKDLTAMGLIESLGWKNAELFRQPSGDGAILALVGQGVDAASMIEPYATMLEETGIGTIVRRTGDIWKGAPGCSLSTSLKMAKEQPDVVEKVVRAFVRGAGFVKENPAEAAEIASKYIGLNPRFIQKALSRNCPNVHAIQNKEIGRAHV